MIKDNTLPKVPVIGGEVMFSIQSGVNLPHIPGKEQFAFQIDLQRFNKDAQIIDDKPKTGFAIQDAETMAFSPKVGLKLPIENQNINIYNDYILVSIFRCDSEDKNFKLADKTLVGFAYIMWKECVERVKDGASDYLQFKLELRDLRGQVDPSVSVTGEIKGEVKWVEFGHAKSSFDKDGKRLETKKMQKTAADFKGKKEGEAGSLRIQFRSYTHSAPLDKKYVVRA